ncbi:SLC13 family permease [Shewanella chilikensis]|jgi:di/tricarboxylate transporter|uniref:SLC13 family permease n=1 Tax=Shewanella chilikensis TaxID=558541 RepID=A0A6G7LXZ9_9GAMM|nr:SLC13 family permease [Shewanella chilikensis]MCE9789971.1 anion permease [Shewanella chilikensis]MCE9852576.1 anion permease [Shewanella chilikensis]QIJ06683.1 SLC13 family permease [Shewanella chilikensis]BCV35909.1 citrate transporter [Shewanella chilikensis]
MKLALPIKPFIFAAAAIGVVVLLLFTSSDLTWQFSASAALVLMTLVLWSTGALPPFMTGLVFFSLATVLQLIDPAILFSGFSSTAVWLIISGFVIGSAISSSGLSQRLAAVIAPYLIGSYTRLITGLVLTAVALGFVMPSSVGRAVVLIPIGMALAEQVGFARGSPGRLGIATALAIACNMPSFAILPANIPNMILAGASETLFDITLSYTTYLLLHFPILGLLKALILIWVVVRIFPAEVQLAVPPAAASEVDKSAADQRPQQRRVAGILILTLLGWVTDTLHGVNPAWIGLAAATLLLLPRWGVVPPKAFNLSIDFATVVFVAAALGLGALVNHSGIGSVMGQLLGTILPDAQAPSFITFMALSLSAAFTGLVATIPGVPTVLTPMAADFAQVTGWSIPAVLMTQVIGFSTVIFPYQVGPLIVAMQLSEERLAELLKITLPLAALTVLVLMPLDYLWWWLLGWV